MQHPVTRDDWLSAYQALTLDDFATAVSWSGCRRGASHEEWAAAAATTHTLGFLLSVVHGAKPFRRPTDEAGAQLFDLHSAIERARQVFERNARTPVERERAQRAQEAEAADRLRVQAARRREDRRTRLQDRSNRGSHLTTWERDFLASTG